MKKINLFFIILVILCSTLTSCSASTPLTESAPALPNSFTADISVSYGGNEYSGHLIFGESSAEITFTSPQGLKDIRAEYSPNGLCTEYKDKISVPNAQALPENGALTAIFKKLGGAFRTASDTQITDTYYIYKNASGTLYVNRESGIPEYIEDSDFKITFGNFTTVE